MKWFAVCLAMLWPVAALGQSLPKSGDEGFEFVSTYFEPLSACVQAARAQGESIVSCRGFVAQICARDPVTSEVGRICSLEEEFAWTDLMSATLPDVIGVASGRIQIPDDIYIAQFNERFLSAREPCFAFPVDQQEAANWCQIDAAIQDVIWHLQLFDQGYSAQE